MNISLTELQKRMSPRRYRHTLSCAETAEKLARHWGANTDDARDAALLHDITRDLSYQNQLKLCLEHDIILNETQKKSPALLHAITGAKVAECDFFANDEICGAVRWHTTGRADMTLLEKIIWLADYIEPNRLSDYVNEVRAIAFKNLDRAILLGFDTTIGFLISKRAMIDIAMIEARNWELTVASANEK